MYECDSDLLDKDRLIHCHVMHIYPPKKKARVYMQVNCWVIGVKLVATCKIQLIENGYSLSPSNKCWTGISPGTLALQIGYMSLNHSSHKKLLILVPSLLRHKGPRAGTGTIIIIIIIIITIIITITTTIAITVTITLTAQKKIIMIILTITITISIKIEGFWNVKR